MFGLSGDFISKITRIGSVPENVILVTADVELYPRDHTFMTSMKNAQFLHPPSPLFLPVRMGPNRAIPPRLWTSKLGLPTPIPFSIFAAYI